MENKPKKSKALIITIIALILLLIAGYLIFKNRDVFGVKTSTSIAKIFSPLISSTNSKNLTPVEQVTPNTKPNSFFNSFSNFLGGMFNKSNQGGILPSGNLCPNGEDNPPDCTTIGGKCSNGKTNPPLCTIDNSCLNGAINPLLCTINPEGSCINGATNPDACTIGPDGKCLNGATNPDACTNLGGDPDLIAGIVAPTSTTINTPTKISATITNNGGSSTVKSFSSFFTIARTLPTATHVEVVTITPLLESKIGNIAEITYNFNTAGEYQIRACADKKSSSDAGVITESNEDNNCGPWTTFTVTNSLPTEGDLCSNGADNPPACTITACENGANNPPACTALPLAPYVNACLAIEQNPLTFTPEEKARLAVLLRQFYLISSTLDTTEDITTIYNEIDQQKNFISQIKDLTNQCYTQIPDSMMLADNWKRHGNPWYTETSGGTFPYTDQNTGYLDYSQLDGGMTPAGYKVISGYYYGTLSRDVSASVRIGFGSINQNIGKTGDSCDKFNNFEGYGLNNQINNKKELYTSHYCNDTGGFIGLFTGTSCYANGGGVGFPGDSLIGYVFGQTSPADRQPQTNLLESGCNWKDGVILDNTERLLNIW